MENAFRILVIRFPILPSTMQQWLKVVRDIVKTCNVSRGHIKEEEPSNATHRMIAGIPQWLQCNREAYLRIISTALVHCMERMTGSEDVT